MKTLLTFSVPLLLSMVGAEILMPPQPLDFDSTKMIPNRQGGPAKGTSGTRQLSVDPAKSVVTGSNSTYTINPGEPRVRSVKSDGDEGEAGSKGTIIGENSGDDKDLPMPEGVLKSLKADQDSNLRGNTEIKQDVESALNIEGGNSDSKLVESSDSKTEGSTGSTGNNGDEPKKDPILSSIEGAERQLTEAFGAVKSKLMAMGKGQKPIKVECGTTRVRVVCSKKGEAEMTETPETEEKPGESTEEEATPSSEEGEAEETPADEE